MNFLQAAMKDKSAKTWRERTTMYKVGSPMKGCHHCGDIEETESGRRRYTSGFQVFRAYKPWAAGWTWKCMECGATDLACWEADALGMTEYMLGKEPIVGTRDAVAGKRYAIRKELEGKVEKPERRVPERVSRIKELEDELARLMLALKEGKKV